MTRMGALEAVVMDHLWDGDGPCTVRQVVEALRPERSLAYTTVLTVLDNLHRKRLVVREKRGRAYLYRAAGTREVHTAEVMSQALEESPDRGGALLRFVERLHPDELAELRRTVERMTGDDTGAAEGS